MSNPQVNAGLDEATNEVRSLQDGRRGLIAAQATNKGAEIFGGYKIHEGQKWDATLGLWMGSPWTDLLKKSPEAGARVEIRF